MKKRIFTPLTSILLLVTLLLCGCDSESIPGGDDNSGATAEEINAKQMALQGMHQFLPDNQGVLSADSLFIAGEIAYEGGYGDEKSEIKLTPSVHYGKNSGLYKAEIALEACGEKAIFEINGNESQAFLSVDGVTEKPFALHSLLEGMGYMDMLGTSEYTDTFTALELITQGIINSNASLFTVTKGNASLLNNELENVTLYQAVFTEADLKAENADITPKSAEIKAIYEGEKAKGIFLSGTAVKDGKEIEFTAELGEKGYNFLLRTESDDSIEGIYSAQTVTEIAIHGSENSGECVITNGYITDFDGEKGEYTTTYTFELTTAENKTSALLRNIEYNFGGTETNQEIPYHVEFSLETAENAVILDMVLESSFPADEYTEAITDNYDIRFTLSPAEEFTVDIPDDYTEGEDEFDAVISALAEKYPLISEMMNPNSEAEIIDAYSGEDTVYTIFPDDGNGIYSTSFTLRGDFIVLADGRTIPFIYETLVPAEEEGEYTTVINGRNYRIYEYVDFDDMRVQVLECTDEIEGYPEASVITYKPDLGEGIIDLGFVFEQTDDVYTITYPDGKQETVKIIYDEDAEQYIAEPVINE